MPESVAITEAAPAAATPAGGGRMLLQLLSEGWGSSGFYGADVIASAGASKVFHEGLPLFLDHPSASEEQDRPERSVRDLAAVLTEDARYDPARRALVAEAKALPTYRGLLSDPDFVAAVGLSIRAGGLGEYGTAQGRDGLIVQSINEAQSVDFVTKAGRGGKVLALLESARAKLREAPTEQTRAAIERAVRAAYHGGDGFYTYVRDYDPDRGLVWFEAGGPSSGGTWEQSYSSNGVDVALLGGRRPVIAETTYRPAAVETPDAAPVEVLEAADRAGESTTTDVTDGAPPTGSTTPTNTEEGPAMSGTSTGATASAPAGTAPVVDTAAVHFEAREAATARDKAVGERDTALREAATEKARADKAERELATFRAVEAARPIVDAQLAESGLPAAAQNKVRAAATSSERVPLTESRQLDQNALRSLVEAEVTAEKAYVAQLAEASGAGQVTGFGAQPAATAPVGSGANWTTPAVEPNVALVEAYKARGLTAPGAAEAAARGRAI